MSFELKFGKPLCKDMRRIVRKQLKRALEELANTSRSPNDEIIHQVRKRFKRIRAILRLVRAGISDSSYQTENICFRDLARPLTEVRDAKILLDTMESLREYFKDNLVESSFSGLRKELCGNLQSVKAQVIEQAIYQDIVASIPDHQPERRFYPYLQVHEFEGLLFSDPDAFARGLGQQLLSGQLHAIRNAFATPEDINDDPNLAPSKRVAGVYRSYRKVIEGTLAAQEVGVQMMRQQCPHFHQWVSGLEAAMPLA